MFNMIRDIHDTVVDKRINRWALTALATMLANGDMEDTRTWVSFVRRDLHALGATEAEIVWVTGILLNINPTLLFLAGEDMEITIRPELAVVGLCTLNVSDPDKIAIAIKRVNESLDHAVNPLDRITEEED
ncbi:hypothetical protein BMS3Bbin04_00787 [bacterium BMS3Bbin04]|nr:hypothetical protein BMS3Bbin04_00787 [bacterium BMS3Bbin04]